MNFFCKRFYATINIKGLDRVKLLRNLWENAEPAVWYTLNGAKPPEKFCEKKARDALRAGYRIDYHQGRAIKMNMHTDQIDNSYYVKYWGETAFNRALKATKLRKK